MDHARRNVARNSQNVTIFAPSHAMGIFHVLPANQLAIYTVVTPIARDTAVCLVLSVRRSASMDALTVHAP